MLSKPVQEPGLDPGHGTPHPVLIPGEHLSRETVLWPVHRSTSHHRPCSLRPPRRASSYPVLCAQSRQLFATLWTVACQAPLSMGLPRQEYWSGLPSPTAGDLPQPGVKPTSPALASGFFTTEPKLLTFAHLCKQVDGSEPQFPHL